MVAEVTFDFSQLDAESSKVWRLRLPGVELSDARYAAQAVRANDFDLIVDRHPQSAQCFLRELFQVKRRELTAQHQAIIDPFGADGLAMLLKSGMQFQSLSSEGSDIEPSGPIRRVLFRLVRFRSHDVFL